MLTVHCKSYSARHDADGITLEISESKPTDVLPRLIKRADAAARLAVSERHFDSLVAKAGIQPVDGLPVRYRETDLLKLTLPAAERISISRVVVPMAAIPPKAAPTSTSRPAATATVTPQPRQKTKFRI